MKFLLIKYLITAGIIVAVSEIAKRSDRFGALLASLPLVTLMVLFWMYFENQPASKLSNHAWYTLWYVVPTLPMFAAFPALLPRLGFWYTMLASVGITFASFLLVALLARRVGVELL